MSEEVLWYVARISGLMAWILGFAALAAGLLARSEPARGTSAGYWVADTRNMLGRLSVVALLVHGAATAAADQFGLQLQSVLTGRSGGQWLVSAMVVGVVCGWAMVGVEFARLASRRLGPISDAAFLVVATAAVAGGAYHGWLVGSDTQNPLAITVVVLSGLLLLGAAAIGLTSLLDGQDPLTVAPPAISADGEDLVLGNGVDQDSANGGPRLFDPGPSVSLSRTVDAYPPDAAGGRKNNGSDSPGDHPNSNAEGTDRLDPTVSGVLRGPQITSARDVTSHTSAQHSNDEEVAAPGAWSMRKLPDAPKPAHRKPKR